MGWDPSAGYPEKVDLTPISAYRIFFVDPNIWYRFGYGNAVTLHFRHSPSSEVTVQKLPGGVTAMPISRATKMRRKPSGNTQWMVQHLRQMYLDFWISWLGQIHEQHNSAAVGMGNRMRLQNLVLVAVFTREIPKDADNKNQQTFWWPRAHSLCQQYQGRAQKSRNCLSRLAWGRIRRSWLLKKPWGPPIFGGASFFEDSQSWNGQVRGTWTAQRDLDSMAGRFSGLQWGSIAKELGWAVDPISEVSLSQSPGVGVILWWQAGCMAPVTTAGGPGGFFCGPKMVVIFNVEPCIFLGSIWLWHILTQTQAVFWGRGVRRSETLLELMRKFRSPRCSSWSRYFPTWPGVPKSCRAGVRCSTCTAEYDRLWCMRA